ncbi:hypothetical protein FIBSPDRAFT_1051659 [Athelia psychrophila]|uniref:Uncharacterized protein n=1 Tax=Athelia psychrophila TaxID=1759441 RepID=A0A165YS03_9AGAM|nr:hypothetical protein FIBSPDRAFT_1051659 [Fibularhizoctonia sp. CBS 109695]
MYLMVVPQHRRRGARPWCRLLSVKFSTHLDEPGVAYLHRNGNPLWFTLGKGSEDLIPTGAHPHSATLSDVQPIHVLNSYVRQFIPVLVGGSDLMIPGIVQLLGVNAPLHVDQLVAITQHHPAQAGAPLAVGMALLGEEVRARGRREVGQGGAGTAYVKGLPAAEPEQWQEEEQGVAQRGGADGEGQEQGEVADEVVFESTLSPQEVTSTSAPRSSSPSPRTSRTTLRRVADNRDDFLRHPSEATTPIDIKKSSHKLLSTFLKAVEKDGLVKLKELKAGEGTELLEFMKRDDMTRRVADKMQPRHEIAIDGKEPIIKYEGRAEAHIGGGEDPAGEEGATLISGFEPFLVTADVLAELRQLCASATSMSPVQGKAVGMEVLVQGKQLNAVAGLLGTRGVPKRWIVAVDLSSKKK